MSATAIELKDTRLSRFWDSTNGKKAVMAVSGVILFTFVVGHLLGNLQIFLPDGGRQFNAYAAALKKIPELLWGVRIMLLVMVALHIWSSFELWLLNLKARPVPYVKKKSISSTYASRTMYWSGPIVAAFVIYHLMHFTFGTVAITGLRLSETDVYSNVVEGFRVWPISVFYIFAMALLCTHLYHGAWSMFQTLGAAHPRYTPVLKRLAKVVAVLIFLGFSSIPAAVLAGLLSPHSGSV